MRHVCAPRDPHGKARFSAENSRETTGAKPAVEARKVGEDIPFALCTGYSDVIDERGAKSLGIDAFISKSIEYIPLSPVVRNVSHASGGGRTGGSLFRTMLNASYAAPIRG